MRAIALGILVVMLVGCERADEAVEQAVEEIDEAAGVDTVEGPGEGGPLPYRVVIQAGSYAYQPSDFAVPSGPVRFVVTNQSDIVHGFEVEGHGYEEEIAEIAPGSTDSLTVEITQSGDYLIYCPVADHRERGMTGTLTVQ